MADDVADLGHPSYKFDDIYATGSVTTSDRNLKTNIANSDLGLSFIEALKPRKYKWKDKAEKTETVTIDGKKETRVVQPKKTHTRIHYGLIAQEVKEALGEKDFAGYVDPSKKGIEGSLSLRYTEFIAPLIKAVQELSAKVAKLEAG